MTHGFEVRGDPITLPSGMNREPEDEKIDYTLALDGPMFKRWARLLTAAIPTRGRRNWMLAHTEDDLGRFRRAAFRHFIQWYDGELDEDHAAAVIFNLNGAEYVKARLDDDRPA